MSMGLFFLALALTAFVASHFLLSHTWRARLIGALGENGFQACYSVTAVVLLMLTLVAYHFSDHGPVLWSSNNLVLQVMFSVVGYFAVALFVGSLFGNPALIGANLNGLSTRSPDGVFLITRHPMMFAVAIWSLAQMLIVPSARNIISCSAFIVLALVGSSLQDRKKATLTGREWILWTTRTRFWPDLRQIGNLGMIWGFAVIPWLVVTWVELRATQVPVGVWYFFPDLPY